MSASVAEAEAKKTEVDAWLREVGISAKGEEMLREYIGEGGGLEDVRTLEEEDKLELGTSLFCSSDHSTIFELNCNMMLTVIITLEIWLLTKASWCFVFVRSERFGPILR